MNALLFPGQGSQEVGMGRALYDGFMPARRILEEACDVLGYDLQRILFCGPQEKLTDTRYAQPAIYTVSAMYLEKLKQMGISYQYAAGHSLGEYSALLAAGAYDFVTGLKLVEKRARAMSRQSGNGAMAAVIGLSESELGPYIQPYEPEVVIANLNSATQIVISGAGDAVDEIGRKMEEIEKASFKKLRVGGAFHSPQMENARIEMEREIDRIELQEPNCFVSPNITGVPTKNVDTIRKCLRAQITEQVRWYDTIMNLKERKVDLFYEVGHGDVLKRLNKTITFRPRCIGIGI